MIILLREYTHRGWAHWRVSATFWLGKTLTNFSCAADRVLTSGLWLSSLTLYQFSHPCSHPFLSGHGQVMLFYVLIYQGDIFGSNNAWLYRCITIYIYIYNCRRLCFVFSGFHLFPCLRKALRIRSIHFPDTLNIYCQPNNNAWMKRKQRRKSNARE